MQKQDKTHYWGVVIYIPGQRPQLLKHQFAERILAEHCCQALRRQIPTAQFGVRLVMASDWQ